MKRCLLLPPATALVLPIPSFAQYAKTPDLEVQADVMLDLKEMCWAYSES